MPGEKDIDMRREEIIDELTRAFSQSALSIEEYERLVEAVQRAESRAELEEIASFRGSAMLSAEAGDARAPAPRPPGGELAAGRESRTVLSLLGDRTIDDTDFEGREVVAVSLLGDVTVDLRGIDLPPGEILLRKFSLLGDTKIIVPPEVAVRRRMISVLGDEKTVGRKSRGREAAYTLVVTGFSLLGDVRIEYSR